MQGRDSRQPALLSDLDGLPCWSRAAVRHNRRVPSYEIQITDPDGGDPVNRTFDSDDALDTGDTFEFDGSTLSVTSVEEPDDASFEAKLVCDYQGGRPHYF